MNVTRFLPPTPSTDLLHLPLQHTIPSTHLPSVALDQVVAVADPPIGTVRERERPHVEGIDTLPSPPVYQTFKGLVKTVVSSLIDRQDKKSGRKIVLVVYGVLFFFPLLTTFRLSVKYRKFSGVGSERGRSDPLRHSPR